MKPVKLIQLDQVPEKTPAVGGGAWRRLVSNEDTQKF
jgi:hypothetical protein